MVQSLSLLLSFSVISSAAAQPPREVHPWRTECGNRGCFVDWYCQPSTDLCQKCPDVEGGVAEDDCRSMLVLADDDNSSAAESNETDKLRTIATTTHYTNETALQIDLDSCIEECVRQQGGDPCTEEKMGGCDPGRFFCNYRIDTELDEDSPREGTCEACPDDVRSCLDDPEIASPFGVEECILCDVGVCVPLHFSVATEVDDGDEGGGDAVVGSAALQGSPAAVAEGEVASCDNLVHREELTCVPGGNDLSSEETRRDGKICLVHDTTKNAYFVDVVNKCAALGGVAAVVFQENSRVENDEAWTGSLSYLPTSIPSVVISYDDGMRWEKERLGRVVRINVTDVGDACIRKQFCSDDVPCVGSSAGKYCDYKWGGGDGGNGFCRDCPTDADGHPDPLQCFFNTDEDRGKTMGQSGVESCAATCAGSLKFPSCKFCPEDIGGFDFGLDDEDDQKCRFCPMDDVAYPEKDFPLFGEGVQCWMVQKFFDSVDVKSDARNCELAQMMNYVCGCSGSGYLGANTEAKQAVLAWLPRISAILSILGSSYIIYDTSKSRSQRRRVNKQLLLVLSIFDILGAWGYAFTTLPIPEDHEYGPIYGAKGDESTCVTQGFFIQVGTVSCYMNVSLAVYYYLVIKHGFDDERLKRIRWALFLAPMAVGFAWAFAGISFYDSLNLWCNNVASYWPDIPVAVAIGLATIIMALVCWDVYTKERASAKWRGGAGAVNRSAMEQNNESKNRCCSALPRLSGLSSQVFWQSFFYLLAFYLTWPPYLALQYAWAGGRSFTNYGLILTAATLVPLQGFWNMLVYIRPRYLQKRRDRSSPQTRTTEDTAQSKSGRWTSWRPSAHRRSRKSNDNPGSTDKKDGNNLSEERGPMERVLSNSHSSNREEKQNEGEEEMESSFFGKNDSCGNHEKDKQEEGEVLDR